MLRRRRYHQQGAGPSNEVIAQVVDFGPDPRGTAMFAALSTAQAAPMSGQDGQVYVGDRGAPERSFNGTVANGPQAFTGAAALALYGTAQPVSPRNATFDTARAADALNDTPMRIFAARAARQGAR